MDIVGIYALAMWNGYNASRIWRQIRARGKKCCIAIFSYQLVKHRRENWHPWFLLPSLLLSGSPCFLLDPGEQQRMNDYLCLSVAPEGRETVITSGGDLPPGDRSINKEIPSSSVLPWVGTEMTGSLGLLSCVFYVYLERRAGVVLPPG